MENAKKILFFIVTFVILIFWWIYLIFWEKILAVYECKKLVSEEMKDPDSMNFREYSYSFNNWVIEISWDYRATNSYWAFVRGYFFCNRIKLEWEYMKAWISDTPINNFTDIVNNLSD